MSVPGLKRKRNRTAEAIVLIALFSAHWILLRDSPMIQYIIGYPLVYLTILCADAYKGFAVRPLALWLATNCAWCVFVFNRSVSIVAFVLFGYLAWSHKKTIWGWWSVILLVLLAIATLIVEDEAAIPM